MTFSTEKHPGVCEHPTAHSKGFVLNHAMLRVKDPAVALDFYSRVFGMRVLRKLDFPLSAIILGFVLGELMEDNLRRALSISAGELSILWSSPISLCLWGLTALMLGMPALRKWRARRSAQPANA